MMGQVQKPLEEIMEYLNGAKKIVIMGCGGCATIFHTGGVKEVEDMAETLKKEGKEVLAAIGLPFGVFCCYLPMSSMFVNQFEKEFRDCDAVLMMSCGDGLQVVRSYLEKEKGIIKPVYPANNALGFFGEGPKEFLEKCQGCGECEVGLTAGICPLTQCAKGLLNGPCGGTRPNGKCEVDPEKDCAWVLIYERLKKLGKLSLLKKIHPPHNWEKALRPRKLEVEPIDLLEKLKETKKVIQSLGI
ncbi:MAG TPA: 5,10-methylenetetrahydrofolate reductase [bacterium]|nr:5,10-methylenetetrahydrofolate reductase [bacterium]HEX68131.1 5,10-methylenetetrahydrofolate reductase [bacterium]